MTKRRMKKPTKIIIVLFVVTACAAIFFYQYLFNSISATDKAAITGEMDRITQEVLKVVEEGTGAPTQAEGEDSASSSENGSLEDKEALIKTTISAYDKGFEKLQTEGNSIISKMIEGAKSDYATSGGGKIELGKLASSYTNRAKALETGMDSSVDVLVDKMSTDLKAVGMSDSDIKTHIKEIRAKYKEEKDLRRKQILDAAKKYL